MSQSMFCRQGKVAALGLLMSLVLLTGATCDSFLNDLLPGVGRNTGTTNQPGTGQTLSPATINVSSPTGPLRVAAGTVVQISWQMSDPSNQAEITVFYDRDRNSANGFTTLNVLNNSDMGIPAYYNWNTTGMSGGTYYVGARIDDGTNQPVTSYAVGQVTIGTGGEVTAWNLGDIGSSIPGCVFEGMSFVGRLGDVMAGRFDVLGSTGVPDGASDIVLVAPKADSHYVQEQEVGEAYVIFGWNSRTGARDVSWYNGGRFNVNQVGTDSHVPGFIVVGPAYQTSSMGITSVLPLADLDGDGGAELMFGTPELIGGLYEAQDYDPETAGYLNAPFARPPTPTPIDDWHDWYGGLVWSSGYITVLASTTPRLYDPAAGATGLGGVIHIDEIGADPGDPTRRESHPRSIRYLQSGVRVYPYARLTRYYDFLQNDYRFGQELGAEDIDGDGVQDWLIAAPNNLNGAGQIDIGYSSQAWLWTEDLPDTASSYSWPYMIPGPNNIDRIPVWPFGLIDRLRGDELNAPNGQLGNPTGLGDYNGDGIGDIGASAWKWDNGGLLPEAGATYLVFGRAPFGDHDVGQIKSSTILNALPGIAIYGTAAGDRVGAKMAALGRPNYGMIGHPVLRGFNADTLPDWVISAPGRSREVRDANGNVTEVRAGAGAVAIVLGNRRLDGRFTWDQIGTPDLPGLVITGSNQGDGFGTYIAQAGDVNGDGADDLLVAAPGAENPITGAQDAGAVYLILAPSMGSSGALSFTGEGSTVDIESLMQNGPLRVRAFYGAAAGNRIGPVAGAGDIDGDGYEDILIGDPVASPLGRTEAGQVYLLYGRDF